ncbi:hypothetical protein ACF1BQ_021860 [Bradyrhizobium sp. RDT10]
MRSEAHRTTNDAYGAFVINRTILSGKSAPEVTAALFALAIRSSLILNTIKSGESESFQVCSQQCMTASNYHAP